MSTLKASNIQPPSDSDPLIVSTNATQRVRVGSDGLVGIGTSSPLATLHVDGSSRVSDSGVKPSGGNAVFSVVSTVPVTAATTAGITLASFLSNNPGGSDYRPRLFVTATSEGIVLNESYNLTAASNLMFAIGHVEKMRLTVDGRLAIGVPNPNAKITVGGGSYTAINDYCADFSSDGNNGGFGGVLFSQNSSNAFKMWAQGTGNASESANYFYMDLINRSTGATLGGLDKKLLTLRGNGWLGVGEDNPTSPLHIGGRHGNADTPQLYIKNGAGGDDQVSGCMGIRIDAGDGTGDARLFDIRNSTASKDHFIVRKNQTHVISDVASEAFGGADFGAFLVSNTANTRQLQTGISHTDASNGYVWVEGWVPTVGGSPLVLQPSGSRVGIGVTAPSVALDVAGQIKSSSGLTVTSGSVSLPATSLSGDALTASSVALSKLATTVLGAASISSGINIQTASEANKSLAVGEWTGMKVSSGSIGVAGHTWFVIFVRNNTDSQLGVYRFTGTITVTALCNAVNMPVSTIFLVACRIA